jgi:hypothetical protein
MSPEEIMTKFELEALGVVRTNVSGDKARSTYNIFQMIWKLIKDNPIYIEAATKYGKGCSAVTNGRWNEIKGNPAHPVIVMIKEIVSGLPKRAVTGGRTGYNVFCAVLAWHLGMKSIMESISLSTLRDHGEVGIEGEDSEMVTLATVWKTFSQEKKDSWNALNKAVGDDLSKIFTVTTRQVGNKTVKVHTLDATKYAIVDFSIAPVGQAPAAANAPVEVAAPAKKARTASPPAQVALKKTPVAQKKGKEDVKKKEDEESVEVEVKKEEEESVDVEEESVEVENID